MSHVSPCKCPTLRPEKPWLQCHALCLPLNARLTSTIPPAPTQLSSVPCTPLQVPNPEDKTAMAAGVDAVLRSQSDLGVVLDTDVDRSAVVSRDGQAIAQNRYIALMSVITLR